MDMIFWGTGFFGKLAYQKYKTGNYKNKLLGFMDNKRQENTAGCR